MELSLLSRSETTRLKALKALGILDTPPEQAFNELTFLAAQICEAPIAGISFADENRHWFKSKVGFEINELPYEDEFLLQTILSEDAFEIQDVRLDERFKNHPLVTAEPGIRSYVGVPLTIKGGLVVGSLFIMDRASRRLTQAQIKALKSLANQAMVHLESRLQMAEQRARCQELADEHYAFNVASIVAVTDIHGRILSANDLFCEISGYSREELIGKDHRLLNSGYHSKEFFQHLWKIILSGQVFRGHIKNRRKNGENYWVDATIVPCRDASGNISKFISIRIDITKQKEAEVKLQDSKIRKQFAIEASQQGVWDWNCETNEVFLSNRWKEILGFGPDEIQGTTEEWERRIHPDDRDKVYADLNACLRGETRQYRNEHRLLSKDGSYKWILDQGIVIERNDQGDAIRMIGTHTDITERRKMDQMKDEFVSTVSHELRTPLTSIRGALGLLRGGAGGVIPESMSNLIEIAIKNTDRLSRLINDILDIEKIEAGSMRFDLKVHNLVGIVKTSVESLQTYASQFNVPIELELDQDDLSVNCDLDRLQQVIVNLLSNAIKFSREGEPVTVRVEASSSSVRVSVIDRGLGIPKYFQSKVFSKFSQEDSSDNRKKGGTGLGLNITKAIVERLGGRISFESQEGVGTTFYFDLPRWRDSPLVDFKSLQVGDGYPSVLICEDDRDIAYLLRLMVEEAGYSSGVAHMGNDALRALRSGKYSAMTLDLDLPDRTGISIIQELRSDPQFESFPILIVSAMADETKSRLSGTGISVIDWLQKPISRDRLITTLSRRLKPNHKFNRILHIEDDPDILALTKSLGSQYGNWQTATTKAAAIKMLETEAFDIVVLDIQLPDGSGWDLLPVLKKTEKPPSVLVFSSAEVSEEKMKEISAALVKSKTSHQDFKEALQRLLDTLRFDALQKSHNQA